MKAVRVHAYGGPEALSYEELDIPKPGPGEALVKIAAAGVNFIDVYHRIGLYPLQLPLTLGVEAAGVVEAVGPGVLDFKPDDRVAYAQHQGAYAEYAVVPSAKLIPIPQAVDDRQAAAAMLQGMTAHYLVDSTYPLKPGDTALIHAAAGGVGLLLVQMAKARGARVFGTVSTEEKAALVRQAGADEIILYTQADFETEVKRLTAGSGLDVVYDSVGRTTFDKSMNCLHPRGMMVLFGQSSGVVPPFDPNTLQDKGSIFLTRPTLRHYIASREELLRRAGDVFSAIASGELKLRIDRSVPLSEAAEAQRQLERRATAGKLIVVP